MKSYRTGNQNWVREHNLSILMKQLWELNEPVKRSYLTKISGLNKSTVGNLLKELISLGFVRGVGFADSTDVGRPSSLIDINPDGGRIIGIEIGKDFISLVISDLKANIVSKVKTTSTSEGKPLLKVKAAQVLKRVEALISEAVNQIGREQLPLIGIGIGIPAMIDVSTGAVINSDVLEWRGVSIKERLLQRFNTPVFVGNDADVSALGEWMVGVARKVNNFVYISSNVGIGGGLVLDGKLYRGENGSAGEVGHMVIDIHGPRCLCGNYGCLELYIRPKTILTKVKNAAEEGQTPILMEVCNGMVDSIDMDNIFQAANLGDAFIVDYLREIACYLGVGITNLINIFNPKMVVIGGVLSSVGPTFHNQVVG